MKQLNAEEFLSDWKNEPIDCEYTCGGVEYGEKYSREEVLHYMEAYLKHRVEVVRGKMDLQGMGLVGRVYRSGYEDALKEVCNEE